jgi:hypothetical protein
MFIIKFQPNSHGIKTLNILTIICKSFKYNNLIKLTYIWENWKAAHRTQYYSRREANLSLLFRKMLAVYWKYRTEDVTVGYGAFYHFARLDLRMRIRHCIYYSFVNRGSLSDGRNQWRDMSKYHEKHLYISCCLRKVANTDCCCCKSHFLNLVKDIFRERWYIYRIKNLETCGSPSDPF